MSPNQLIPIKNPELGGGCGSVLYNLLVKHKSHLLIDISICRITFETGINNGEEG
jgi:hypothetical protein